MKSLAILGASGHGKVVADVALCAGCSEITFFDDAFPAVRSNGRWSVVGDTRALLERSPEFDAVIVAIGVNSTRLKVQRKLANAGLKFIALIHPHAVLADGVKVGDGTVVMAGAIINTDSVIDEACIVNTSAIIDHDCNIAAGAHISPGAALAGGVSVGSESWVGIGACVKQLVKIGASVVVGAGSVVLRDIPEGETVVGNPARALLK